MLWPVANQESGSLDRPAKILAVAQFLVGGGTRAELVLWAAERMHWPDSEASLLSYIPDARAEIASWQGADRKAEFSMAVERLNKIYGAAMAAKPPNLKTATAAQSELNELCGLHAAKKIELDSTVRALSEGQLYDELMAMAAKIRAPELPPAVTVDDLPCVIGPPPGPEAA